ncbi:MAG: hypothetical protein AB2A00_38250 [Myxococcota bacterium]
MHVILCAGMLLLSAWPVPADGQSPSMSNTPVPAARTSFTIHRDDDAVLRATHALVGSAVAVMPVVVMALPALISTATEALSRRLAAVTTSLGEGVARVRASVVPGMVTLLASLRSAALLPLLGIVAVGTAGTVIMGLAVTSTWFARPVGARATERSARLVNMFARFALWSLSVTGKGVGMPALHAWVTALQGTDVAEQEAERAREDATAR